MLCYRCGSHVPDGSESCGNCGQRFDGGPRGKTGVLPKRKLSELESAGVQIGEVLAGRYEVRSMVGQGPAGAVLRALDKEVDVEIGLKLIAPRLLQTAEERAEFIRLLKLAKKLSHPNIVRIYEVGTLDGEGAPSPRPFFTMQLLDGLTLRRVIDLRREKGQLFALREVEPILAQVALALEHAKSFGPHGDVKPDNVIVLPDLLKVTDFGLAPAIPSAPFVAAQKARKSEGYLSPEALAGRSIDVRADVYALGVILGEMVAGVFPSASRVPELRTANPELPPALEALYRRAVNQNAQARFPSAAEFAQELLAIAETTAPPLPKAPPPSAPKPAGPAPTPRTKAKPPPPPESSGPFDVKTEIEPAPDAAVVPTPAPPVLQDAGEGDEQTEKTQAPRRAEPTQRARSPKSREATGSAPTEMPTRAPRPRPPPPPPVDERRGPNWAAIIPAVLVILGAAAYFGQHELVAWKAQQAEEIKAQLEKQMERELAEKQREATPDAGTPAAVAAPDAGPPKVVQGPAAPTGAQPATTGPVAANGGTASTGTVTPVKAVDPVERRPVHPVVTEEHAGGGTSCPAGMRYVRGGSFRLGTPGSDDLSNFGDRPEHRAATKGYCIDLYEYPDRPDERPEVNVTWEAASSACAAQGKRLCSEEEWEKACKGPDNLRFPYGQAFSSRTCNAGKGGVVPAGTFSACKSGYGLFDMSGNAAEWTSTRFQGGVSDRTVKGGSFSHPDYDLRCSARQNKSPGSRAADVGFRCCANPT